MALRYADNFGFWTTLPGTFTTNSGSTISSGKLLMNSGGVYTQLTLDAQATWIVNMRINQAAPSVSPFRLVSFLDGGTVQCVLGMKNTGKLAFYRGDLSTQLGSDSVATLTIDTDTTYYDIEIKVVINNSTGSFEVRINGAADANLTASSQNTRSSSNNSADILRFGDAGGTFASNTRYDQIVVMDSSGSEMNDFLGVVNVNLHQQTGAGNYAQFTPSAGSNYQNVDDSAPDGDSTYNESNTPNQIDSFAMGNLPAGTTTVHALYKWWNAKRTDATARGLSPLFRISSTDYVGTNQNLGASYQYYGQAYPLSPATSSAWGVSEVDGLEAGYKLTT